VRIEMVAVKYFSYILALLLLTSSCGGGSSSATVTADRGPKKVSLSWEVPTARENGLALTESEISLCKIYYGSSPGAYSNFTTSPCCFASIEFSGSTNHFVAVTCIDTEGNESDFSNETEIDTSIL